MSKHIDNILHMIEQEIANTKDELKKLNDSSMQEEINRMLAEYSKKLGRDMLEKQEKELFIQKHSSLLREKKRNRC